jgi:hypothetical protein
MTPIVNNIHTSNDSLQRLRVPLSVVTRIERECSQQGDTTEMIPIMKRMHTYNDNFLRRRVPLSEVTRIESDSSRKVT